MINLIESELFHSLANPLVLEVNELRSATILGRSPQVTLDGMIQSMIGMPLWTPNLRLGFIPSVETIIPTVTNR